MNHFHRYYILKHKDAITYIRVFRYSYEMGYACRIIKLYKNKVTTSKCYLQSLSQYEKCSSSDYFNISKKYKEHIDAIGSFTLKSFNNIFKKHISLL
jgi:hypothetical protein